MSSLLVALFVFCLVSLPVFAGSAAAQTGNAQAGKTLWDGPATQCKNCHGGKGEGAFGPDLAGRKITVAQFRQAVRKPWGIMPAFVESQVSDSELADFVAYFDSLPASAQPGPWRFEVPANAPRGQQLGLAAYGCFQCHGPTFNGPRQDAGAVGADFEWFKGEVYNHTTAHPNQIKILEEQPPIRIRMGNFSPMRFPESELLEIFNWAKDVGFRPNVAGQLSAGVPGNGGVTYTLNVENNGLKGKGLNAENLDDQSGGARGLYRREHDRRRLPGCEAGCRIEGAGGPVAPEPSQYQGETDLLAHAVARRDRRRQRPRQHQVDEADGETGPNDQANIAPAPVAPQTN